MLLIEISHIPPEGLELNAALDPGEIHLEGEESFAFEAGGTLRCRVERGEDQTVHVFGWLGARLGLHCGRCLEPFGFALDQNLDLFYLPHRADQEEEDEVDLSDRDMVVGYYRNNRLDLGEVVREQFFLSLPLRRLCREECRGLCPVCGVNRNVVRCECAEPEPRLAPLKELFGKSSS